MKENQHGGRFGIIDIRILTAMDAAAYRGLRIQALRTNPEAFATTYEDYLSRSMEQVAAQLEPDADHFTLGPFSQDLSLPVGRHKG